MITYKRFFRNKEFLKIFFNSRSLKKLQRTLDTQTPLITYKKLFEDREYLEIFFTPGELKYLKATLFEIWHGTTPVPPPVTANFSLVMGSTSYQADTFAEMQTYLSTLSITAPATLTINTEDPIQPAGGTWNIDYSNGAHLFTVKAGVGKNPVIDGQKLAGTVLSISSSNVVWDGVDVINAFTSDTDAGGTIIRFNGNQSNITVKNCLIKHGFVGIRGTTKIDGITLQNLIIEEVNFGSIRLGGNSFDNANKYEDFDLRVSSDYDLYNVSIDNITVLDTLAGANIPNTTQAFSPLILLKMTENVTVKGVNALGLGSVVIVESSKNVTIDAVKAVDVTTYGVSVTGSDVVSISNSYSKPKVGTAINHIYLDTIRNLKLVHNTFIYSNQFDGVVITKARRVLKVVGNLFVTDYNAPLSISFASTINGAAYTRSMAQDFQEEHDNVFVSEGGGYEHLLALYGVNNGSDVLVRKSNTWSGAILDSTYRSTYPSYGVNSSFQDTNVITLTSRLNPDSTVSGPFYLGGEDSSITGRNMIASSVDALAAKDREGFVRIYPTDAGAFDRDAVSKS